MFMMLVSFNFIFPLYIYKFISIPYFLFTQLRFISKNFLNCPAFPSAHVCSEENHTKLEDSHTRSEQHIYTNIQLFQMLLI